MLFVCLLCCCLFVLDSVFGLVFFSGVDDRLMVDLILEVCGYVIVLLSLFVCFYMWLILLVFVFASVWYRVFCWCCV